MTKDNKSKDNKSKDNKSKDNRSKDNKNKDNRSKDNKNKDNKSKDNRNREGLRNKLLNRILSHKKWLLISFLMTQDSRWTESRIASEVLSTRLGRICSQLNSHMM